MKKKIYGKLIGRYFGTADGEPGGLQDRCLEIYEIKTGLKGILWDSGKKGWKAYEPISVCKFLSKDRDDTPYRVKEYFGFQRAKNVLDNGEI